MTYGSSSFNNKWLQNDITSIVSLAINEFSFRRMWWIKQIEEGVIYRGRRPRWITTSEICLILHILRKPNSLTAFYPFKIIPSVKTELKHAYLHRCQVHLRYCTFRFVQLRKYSPNSRCRPLSCLLAVFAMFLAIISPSSSCSSYSWNEWNVRHFFFTTKTPQPRLQVFSVTVP